jgi:hypothetical protein
MRGGALRERGKKREKCSPNSLRPFPRDIPRRNISPRDERGGRGMRHVEVDDIVKCFEGREVRMQQDDQGEV